MFEVEGLMRVHFIIVFRLKGRSSISSASE